MRLSILDLLLTALSIYGAVLTVHRVYRKGTTDGLALGFVLLSVLATSTWTAYGFDKGLMTQGWTNGIAALSWLMVLAVAVVKDRVGFRRTAFMLVISTFALVIAHQTIGVAALGAFATACAMIGKIPQAVESWLRPGGVAISLGAFGTHTFSSSCWVAYGLLHADAWICVTASYGMAHSLFVVVRTVQGRRRQAEVVEEQFEQLTPRLAA